MKTIPEKFTKKGYKHILVKREENVAIFKRHSVSSSKKYHYEVVIISSHNGITINGNYIEPGELYPSSSQWGDVGWTCLDLEAAERRFEYAKKQVQQSKENKEKNLKKKTVKSLSSK